MPDTAITPRSILICATPRSGSTFLCSLFTASGVAGRPESWFRRQDRSAYAADWGIAAPGGARIDFPAFLARARSAGESANGVFAARLMAETRPELMKDLAAAFGAMGTPALIARAFGPTGFVFLYRRDTIAQAVSRHRAESEGIWHRNADGSPLEMITPAAGSLPGYDAAAIDRFRAEALRGNRSWRAWFAHHGFRPVCIAYEDLAADPDGIMRKTLAALRLAPPDALPMTGATGRLADAESLRRIARYRAERGLR